MLNARRQQEIEEFWRTAPELMEIAGIDEAELMRRFPSFRGTRPRASGTNGNVVPMPSDRMCAAAGDRGDAA